MTIGSLFVVLTKQLPCLIVLLVSPWSAWPGDAGRRSLIEPPVFEWPILPPWVPFPPYLPPSPKPPPRPPALPVYPPKPPPLPPKPVSSRQACLHSPYLGWCNAAGDTFAQVDCDGDGWKDSICILADGQRHGFLSSRSCLDNDNVTLSAAACPEIGCMLLGYTFYPLHDVVGNDLGRVTTGRPDAAALCSETAECLGFNSDGWLKGSNIVTNASSQGAGTTPDPSLCSGFYTKGALQPVASAVDVDHRNVTVGGGVVDHVINYTVPFFPKYTVSDPAWANDTWTPQQECVGSTCGDYRYTVRLTFPGLVRVHTLVWSAALFPPRKLGTYVAGAHVFTDATLSDEASLGSNDITCTAAPSPCRVVSLAVVFTPPFIGDELYLSITTGAPHKGVQLKVGRVYCYDEPGADQQTLLTDVRPSPPPPATPATPLAPPTPPGSSGFPLWAIVVIAVVVPLLLVAGGALGWLFIYRRRRTAALATKAAARSARPSHVSDTIIVVQSKLFNEEDGHSEGKPSRASFESAEDHPAGGSRQDDDGRLIKTMHVNAAANLQDVDEATPLDGVQPAFPRDNQLELFEVLGRGGGGVVHRGLWKGHLPVAAKVAVMSDSHARASGRQAMEALMSTGLCHRNIVSTYHFEFKKLVDLEDQAQRRAATGAQHAPPDDHISDRNSANMCQLVILQELCAGGSLRSLMDAAGAASPTSRAPALAMVQVLQLALDISAGLEHMHGKNMVHADLKPDNVLLQAAGEAPRADGLMWTAKVADFGLSVVFDESRTHASRMFRGTYHYMAPETMNDGVLSKQSDIYSLGLLLYEMACGHCPVLKLCTIQQLLAALGPPPRPSFRGRGDTSMQTGSRDAAAAAAAAAGDREEDGGGRAATAMVRLTFDADETPQSGAQESQQQQPSTSIAGDRSSGANEPPPSSSAVEGNVPLIPPCYPPDWKALIRECLNPVPQRRPPITVVRRRLGALFDVSQVSTP